MEALRPRILLASASPRRRQLLELCGFELECVPARLDERSQPGEAPRDMAIRLAREKALALPWPEEERRPLLAADTVVHRDGRVFEKPSDEEEARRTLLALSGAWHTVTTAFCVRRAHALHAGAVDSTVRFRVLDPGEVARYVASGEAMDKAGAYGIQGLGAFLVAELRGSYSNVVGLPVEEVLASLQALAGRE
jgi:septum formation protein